MFELTPEEWTAIRLSLRIAVVATAVALPFGVAVAWLLARKNFWGKALLDGLIVLPLVLPPVVTGYLLLIWFGRRGPVGSFLYDVFGIVLSFRWTGAALACGIMAFPLLVRPIRLSFEAIDKRLEDAASTLGANPFWRFVTVTLPLALPGIIAGTILCFAKALGEFGATITFVSNIPGETQTISAAIYTYTQVPGGDAAALRLVLVAIVIALAALLASEILRAPRDPQTARRMSMLSLDVQKKVGDLALNVSFESDGPRHRSVRPLRRRQDHVGQSDRRTASVRTAVASSLDDTVLFDRGKGIDMPAHLRRIGYVFQEGRLFPHLSVRENLDYGRWMAGIPRDAAEFARVVAMLDIEPLLERRPGKLSGGERQRVAIGRALMMKPRLLLLDEPLASLDPARKSEIMPYLIRLRDEVGIPMVYVSHYARELKRIANVVVRLDAGRVTAIGGPDILTRADEVAFV